MRCIRRLYRVKSWIVAVAPTIENHQEYRMFNCRHDAAIDCELRYLKQGAECIIRRPLIGRSTPHNGKPYMARLIEFTTNHTLLVGAFIAILSTLFWTFVQGVMSNAVTPARAVALLNRDGALPVDVRVANTFRVGHIINAVQIEPTALGGAGSKLDKHKSRPLLVYCDNGTTSGQLARQLRRAGFGQVHLLEGGLTAWRAENLPLETTKG